MIWPQGQEVAVLRIVGMLGECSAEEVAANSGGQFFPSKRLNKSLIHLTVDKMVRKRYLFPVGSRIRKADVRTWKYRLSPVGIKLLEAAELYDAEVLKEEKRRTTESNRT